MPEPVVVKDISLQRIGGRSRVSAMVDGHQVWFETNDGDLSVSAEAFGCAFLIPANDDYAALA